MQNHKPHSQKAPQTGHSIFGTILFSLLAVLAVEFLLLTFAVHATRLRFCIGQTGGHRLEAGSVKEVQMKLHASGEDYLETILVLQKKRGMVRSVDVARHMEVSKPSVCHAVATLRDGGFLMMDEDHFLHLTDAG